MPFIDEEQDQCHQQGETLSQNDQANQAHKASVFTVDETYEDDTTVGWKYTPTDNSKSTSKARGSSARKDTNSASSTSASSSSRRGRSSSNISTAPSEFRSTPPPSLISDDEDDLKESKQFLAQRGKRLMTLDEYHASLNVKLGCAEKKRKRGTLGAGRPPMPKKSKKELEREERRRKRLAKEDEFINGPNRHLYADHLYILNDLPRSDNSDYDDD